MSVQLIITCFMFQDQNTTVDTSRSRPFYRNLVIVGRPTLKPLRQRDLASLFQFVHTRIHRLVSAARLHLRNAAKDPCLYSFVLWG